MSLPQRRRPAASNARRRSLRSKEKKLPCECSKQLTLVLKPRRPPVAGSEWNPAPPEQLQVPQRPSRCWVFLSGLHLDNLDIGAAWCCHHGISVSIGAFWPRRSQEVEGGPSLQILRKDVRRQLDLLYNVTFILVNPSLLINPRAPDPFLEWRIVHVPPYLSVLFSHPSGAQEEFLGLRMTMCHGPWPWESFKSEAEATWNHWVSAGFDFLEAPSLNCQRSPQDRIFSLIFLRHSFGRTYVSC